MKRKYEEQDLERFFEAFKRIPSSIEVSHVQKLLSHASPPPSSSIPAFSFILWKGLYGILALGGLVVIVWNFIPDSSLATQSLPSTDQMAIQPPTQIPLSVLVEKELPSEESVLSIGPPMMDNYPPSPKSPSQMSAKGHLATQIDTASSIDTVAALTASMIAKNSSPNIRQLQLPPFSDSLRNEILQPHIDQSVFKPDMFVHPTSKKPKSRQGKIIGSMQGYKGDKFQVAFRRVGNGRFNIRKVKVKNGTFSFSIPTRMLTHIRILFPDDSLYALSTPIPLKQVQRRVDLCLAPGELIKTNIFQAPNGTISYTVQDGTDNLSIIRFRNQMLPYWIEKQPKIDSLASCNSPLYQALLDEIKLEEEENIRTYTQWECCPEFIRYLLW